MQVDARSGRLWQAQWLPSPNFDARPPQQVPQLGVIHGISLPPGQFSGQAIIELFSNRLNPAQHDYYRHLMDLRVSSHLLIRRDGELIQFVDFNQRAWHAGASSYQGRSRCNDFSIGIELEGTDTEPYGEAQYQVLAQVMQALETAYPQLQDWVGHSEIAPGRKTDPGPSFDWAYLNEHRLNLSARV